MEHRDVIVAIAKCNRFRRLDPEAPGKRFQGAPLGSGGGHEFQKPGVGTNDLQASHFPALAGRQPLNDRAASWGVAAVWRQRDSNPALQRLLGLLPAPQTADDR